MVRRFGWPMTDSNQWHYTFIEWERYRTIERHMEYVTNWFTLLCFSSQCDPILQFKWVHILTISTGKHVTYYVNNLRIRFYLPRFQKSHLNRGDTLRTQAEIGALFGKQKIKHVKSSFSCNNNWALIAMKLIHLQNLYPRADSNRRLPFPRAQDSGICSKIHVLQISQHLWSCISRHTMPRKVMEASK